MVLRSVGAVLLASLVVSGGSFGSPAPRLGAKAAQKTTAGTDDAGAAIAGVWRGNSVCVDRNRPCHDEVNVYRFEKIAGKPDTYMVTASKIVDGKEVVMGSGEWRYDEKTKSVESETPRIRLTLIREGWMEGSLTVEGGKEYRKIRLKKAR